MKSRSLAALVMTLVASACSDVTAPDPAPATIVFRVEPSCTPLLFHLFIDGAFVEQRIMAPGDSAVFPVDPGPHAAGAIALDGFVNRTWFTSAKTLAAGDRYVARLTC